MIVDSEKYYAIEKINTFNKIMINTIKKEENKFQFDGKDYWVCSDGVCVQTLINDRILYRIFIEEDKNTSLISEKLLNYL